MRIPGMPRVCDPPGGFGNSYAWQNLERTLGCTLSDVSAYSTLVPSNTRKAIMELHRRFVQHSPDDHHERLLGAI